MKVIEIVERARSKNPVLSGSMSLEQKYFAKIPGGPILLTFFQFLGVVYFINDFIKQKDKLNNDFNQFKQSNGAVPTTNTFSGSTSVQDAQTKYYEQMEQLVGKVAVSVVLAWSRGGFRKILGGVQILLRFIPVVGWIPATIVGILKYVLTLSPALTLLWFEKSNDFLTQFIKKILYSLVGWPVTEGWNTIVSLGTDALKSAGVTSIGGKPIDQVKNKLTIPTDPNSNHNILSGDDSKAIKVGGVVATDKDGYLTVNPQFYYMPSVKNAISIAISDGKSNPIDKIPKRPGAIYPKWTGYNDQFNTPDGFIAQWEKFKGKA
jgi:hypothetical protein